MEALLNDVFSFLHQHYALYLVIIMSITTALIVLLLNLIKKPFKKATIKIKNERVRKFVNRLFIFVFSFGISFGVWYLLNLIAPQYFAIDHLVMFLNGAMPIVAYAFTEGWVSKDKAVSIIKNVAEKTSDGSLTKDEIVDTAKELNSTFDAEKELETLLKK